jgi:hypothetical protein
MMYFGCRRRRLEPKKVDAPCAMGRRRPFNPSTKVLILLANYHCYHFLAKDSINSNARFSSAEIIMLFSVSYSTMLFLLLLIFLSPRSFLILLAVIAIICTVLENFVKLRFFNSQPQYVRLGFGTWCFSSSIISIAVYFGLCFIDLIRTWLGQFIQLCLYRLHFPHLICIAVLGFLVLNGPKLWAAVSTWNSSNKSMMTSEQSSTTAEVDSYDRYAVLSLQS